MKKLIARIKNKILNILTVKRKVVLIVIAIIILLFSVSLGLGLYLKDKIFPGVRILNYDLGLKSKNEAILYLSQNIKAPEKIELVSGDKSFELSLTDISLSYKYTETANEAYETYRNGTLVENIYLITSPFRVKTVDLQYSIDSEKLDEYLQIVSEQVLSEPTYPSAATDEGVVIINKGSPGEVLDNEIFLQQLDNKIQNADFSKIILPFKITDPSLSDEESKIFQERAQKLINKTFTLKNEYDPYSFDEKTIFTFLDFREQYSTLQIENFIKDEVAPQVERLPQNAILHFENDRASEFVPAKEGLSIKTEELVKNMIDNLISLENSENKSFSLDIPVIKAAPEVNLNEVNNLGLKELVGRGSSKFRGSIAGRIHNISLASSKFNGVLVAPDETFSFNKTLGDVSTFTGYKQAYIIKDGRTVLGDGGGVCQVSTTLFRAVLNAGLPIIERRAHSYRVSYYEQESSPGLDATVFDPTTDFKFKNDTPGHLLIQTVYDVKNYSLVFEIYGTNDGRISSVSKPVITASIAPPEDLYIDDPTLPTGTVKQIDYKAWGAKVVFDYLVERNGEQIIDETYVSNYRPWQAVFLRGTGL